MKKAQVTYICDDCVKEKVPLEERGVIKNYCEVVVVDGNINAAVSCPMVICIKHNKVMKPEITYITED